MAELELRKVDRWHHRQVILDELSLKGAFGPYHRALGR